MEWSLERVTGSSLTDRAYRTMPPAGFLKEKAMETQLIQMTPELRDDLRQTYQRAVDTGAEEFTWQGHELLTSYAGYMLDFLDIKFGGTVQ